MENSIKEEKPKSIKTLGLIITIFSALMILGNTLGAVNWSINPLALEIPQSTTGIVDPFSLLFSYYFEMAMTGATIGFLSLICGLYIRKYKRWAHQLLNLILMAAVLAIVFFTAHILIHSEFQEGMLILNLAIYLILFFWSIPPLLLIWYLNKKNVKRHFS